MADDAAGMGTSISLREIEKRYGSLTVLPPFTLDIGKGEFMTLLGPSGSGKTTLLNLLAGLVEPDGGRLLFGDRDVTDLPARERGIGMVFQNYALMPHMSVFENVAFPLRVRKLREAEIVKRVNETLELVNLAALAKRLPAQLSGGQQQRVSIARCLGYRPPIVLMDEPLGALDKKLRMLLQVEIKRLHDQLGFTVVYVTHDQDEAMSMSDRICLMEGGRAVQVSKPADLYFRPQTPFVADFLGEANMIEATLVERDGQAFLERDGLRIGPAPERAATGSSHTVLLRPENVTILASGEPADNVVEGEVSQLAFFGSSVRVTVTLASGATLLARSASSREDSQDARGAKVRLGWPDSSVVVLPKTPDTRK